MSATRFSTEHAQALNQPAPAPERKPASRLAVRTGIRAGAWDDIDDQVAAWWNNLTSSVSGDKAASGKMSA